MLGVARMSTGEKYVVGLEFGAKAVVMGEPEKKGISGAAAEGREGVAAPEGQAAWWCFPQGPKYLHIRVPLRAYRV